MKKRMLSMLLAVLMVVGLLTPSLALDSGDATAPASNEATNREPVSYLDLYVKDGLVFLWDSFDLTAAEAPADGETPSFTMTNKVGEGSITVENALAYDRYFAYNSNIDFSALVPKYIVAGGDTADTADDVYNYNDFSFEIVIKQLDTVNDPAYNFKLSLGTLQIGNASNSPLNESYGVFKGNYWAGAKYVTAKTTYYFDAEGKLLVDGEGKPVTDGTGAASSVEIPHLADGSAQYATDESWSARGVGNYLGQSYALSGTMNYTMVDEVAGYGDVLLNMYRDGVAVQSHDFLHRRGYVSARDTGLAPIVPENLAQAQEMAKNTPHANTVFTVNSTYGNNHASNHADYFAIGGTNNQYQKTGANLGYYNFRIYDKALTAEEIAQNHFADLCGYHGVSRSLIAGIMKLSDADKNALYQQFAASADAVKNKTETSNVSYEDVTLADLETAIKNFVPTGPALYESIYVPGAVLAWNAFDKWEGDAITSDTVLATGKNDVALVVSGGTLAYGNGYLEVLDGTVTAAGLYTMPAAGTAATKTAQVVMEMVPGATRTTKRDLFNVTYVTPFSTGNRKNQFVTFGEYEVLSYISDENIVLHDAWANAYLAANADEASRKDFWTPINQANYEALVALTGYTDQYSKGALARTVSADDAELPNPIGDYSMTGYEASWDGFQILLASKTKDVSVLKDGEASTIKGLAQSKYYAGYNSTTEKYPAMFKSGVAKNTPYYGGTYRHDLDFKFTSANNSQMTLYDYGQSYTRTWVGTVEEKDAVYYTAMKFYFDSALTYDQQDGGKKMDSTAAVDATTFAKTWSDDFVLSGELNARYYAIRHYDFALDDAQIAQNHFADLCGYLGVDLTTFVTLGDEAKATLYAAFANASLDDTTAAEIETAIQDAVPEEPTFYEALYVPGAILVWDAFDKQAGAAYRKDSTLAVAENGNALTANKDLVFVDGALRLVDASLKADVYTKATADGNVAYTTQITMKNIDVVPSAVEGPIFLDTKSATYRYLFGRSSNANGYQAFGVNAQFSFITPENIANHNQWAQAWIDASADANAREGLWWRFIPAHKDALTAQMATDAKIQIKTGAELVAAGKTAQDVAALVDSETVYYTNYDGFAWLVANNKNVYDYGAKVTTTIDPLMFNSYIAITTLNSVAGWWTDADRNATNAHVFGAREFDIPYTMTNTFDGTYSAAEDKYHATQSFYIDGALSAQKLATDAKGNEHKGNSNLNAFLLTNLSADVYSIRIYNKALNEAEMNQNHFVELLEYHKVSEDAVKTFSLLKDEAKVALYAEFAAKQFGDTDAEALTAAINAAYNAQVEAVLAGIGEIVSLDGYQITLYGNTAFRTVFSVNTAFASEDVKLVSASVLYSTKYENLDAMMESDGTGINTVTLYGDSKWSETVKDGKVKVEVSFDANAMTKEALSAEYLFAGICVVEYNGVQYVLITDMAGETITDGRVSMYELASIKALSTFPVSKTVIGIVEAK